MQKVIPEEIIKVYRKIESLGFEVFLVGGSVRNMLLKKPIKDWDMTTNATPQELLKISDKCFYDNLFGTVGLPVLCSGEKVILEITTFRKEEGYSDRRHPEKITWGKTIEEDLQRRDFTINAIALRLTSFAQDKPLNFELIDPYGGQKDLESKLIKAVGNPKERFKEDALRLIRAVRIATELSFQIEENTWREIISDASLLEEVSKERVKNELFRILNSQNAYDGIVLLKDSSLLELIIPELFEGIGVSQKRPGRHHTDDVFTHNLMSLKACPSKDPLIKFAVLIHDVGKPKSAGKDKDDLVTFHNHEVIGAKMAAEICDRFKFSKIEKQRAVNLIRWHMFGVNENQTDKAIRRFIRKIGIENIQDMMDMRIADRLGSGRPAESWRFKLFRQKIEEQLKPAKFSINDLAIDGNDIMKELNIKPGPKVGGILNKLFEEIDEDLSKNNKEYLTKKIKELSSA